MHCQLRFLVPNKLNGVALVAIALSQRHPVFLPEISGAFGFWESTKGLGFGI